MTDITMPQLGETVTEGTITKWHKAVGDQVAEDEILYEVSTDKVDTEVGSPASGYLAEIVVPEGDTVDVGAKLAVISANAPSGDGGGDAEPAPEPEAAQEPEPEPEPEPQATPAPAAEEEPTTGPAEETPAPAPAPTSTGSSGGASSGGDTGGPLLSPVVRRLVAEHDLDVGAIEGTGAGGRITREDVLKVIEGGGQDRRAEAPAPDAAPAPAAAAPAPAAPAASAPSAPSRPAPAPIATTPGERDTTVAHTNIRRRTAEHMIRSQQTSAHAYVSVEVDFEAVERVRRAHKEEFKASEGFSLTYLPFISRAVVEAVAEYPEVNSSFADDELIVHNYLNLGIAVDLDFKGLMVPVVHDADGKRLRALAREISELASKARTKKLGPDDIQGGTFTITNPGPFGTTLTLPIINQPQVAILSTDGIRRKPVVVAAADGAEAIAIHSVGNLTMTWDHRAFDGAYAAAFVNRLRELVEGRDWEAEL